ncbi:RRP6-like protein 3 isoform X1 [Tanacetum coccineum]
MAENSKDLHPYESEIKVLLEKPQLDVKFSNGTMGDMKDAYVWVDDEAKLKQLVEVLSNERVFAVDTEHHSLHSFLGFTALIQISTRNEDLLVDIPIALHDVYGILALYLQSNISQVKSEKSERISEEAKRSALKRFDSQEARRKKVFHGADNDVIWLQRDFHIYVVNLFDTAKACDVLSKPQRSLAYLLETYCGVITNKFYQREDWRQRPLPKDMLEYARMDVHYLLYIADCLVAELKFQKNGQSAASLIISRHLNDPGSSSDNGQAWMHDESLKYVLSDNAIVALAEKVPVTEADISTTISQADTNIKFYNWYLQRDLAKLVDEDPPSIMLLFEPKGQTETEVNKKNICVGCGEGNNYVRHHIIPSCYRLHLPEHLKSIRFNKKVLVCLDCREKAISFAEEYKKKVASDFGIPLFVHEVVNPKVSPLELLKTAKVLLRHGPRMPPQRREELTQVDKDLHFVPSNISRFFFGYLDTFISLKSSNVEEIERDSVSLLPQLTELITFFFGSETSFTEFRLSE